MSIEDRLRALMTDKASEVSDDARMPETLRVRYRRRLIALAAALLVSVAAVTGTTIAVAGYWRNGGTKVVNEPANEPYRCPPNQSTRFDSRWTSPLIEVDRGEVGGRKWLLCVRTIESKLPKADDGYEEGLCMHWQFDSDLGSGLDCSYDGRPVDDQSFSLMGAPGGETGKPDFYFGAVPAETASAEVQVEGGGTVTGEIYDFKELPFKIMIAIVTEPTLTDVRIVLENSDSKEIAQRTIESSLALLEVTKIGSGAGTVTAHDSFDKPAPRWIECGENCSAVLEDGGEYKLIADAAEGSTFLGWGGACKGTLERCDVHLDGETQVTARFEPATE